MRSFNAVCGLPRSGSTLLCNLLNQRHDYHASSTSPICGIVANLASYVATLPEVTSELINRGSTERVLHLQRGAVEGWYAERDDVHIFDKGRGWATQHHLLRRLYPDSVIICTVRDPRQVFASIDAHHAETAELQPAPHGPMAQRAAVMMQTDGLIGSAIVCVEDLLRRDPSRCLVVDYDELVADPQSTLDMVSDYLQVDRFTHDLTDVVATADDVDALYHLKYPHDGSGKVEQRAPRKLPPDVAQHVMKAFPFFCRQLKYSSS